MRTFAPPEHLRTIVKYFWAFESQEMNDAEKTFSAIVDGCPGVIMVQSENDAFCDERKKKLPDIFLYGQTEKPVRFSASGTIGALGICFQPYALKSVFGMDAHELTNDCLDLNIFSNKKQGTLSEILFNAPALADRIRILSAYVSGRVENNTQQTDAATQYAVTQIIQSCGKVSVPELQADLKLSERTLERKFRQAVGISPKLFSRIIRFQQSLDQMRHHQYDKLSDIAYSQAYADQSHFIRVFKEFTGFTPLEFRKQATEVIENFPEVK